MRTIGNFFILLAVASLILGAATGMMTYSAAVRMVVDFNKGRDLVDDLAEDVDTVLRNYQEGRTTNIHDEEIEEIMVDIADGRSEVGDLKDRIIEEATNSIGVAFACMISLVLSGWLFGLGVLFRSAARA